MQKGGRETFNIVQARELRSLAYSFVFNQDGIHMKCSNVHSWPNYLLQITKSNWLFPFIVPVPKVEVFQPSQKEKFGIGSQLRKYVWTIKWFDSLIDKFSQPIE